MSTAGKLFRRFILFAIVTFWGCDKSFDDIAEMDSYVRSEDYVHLQKQEHGGVIFSVKYMPTDVMMISDYKQYFEDKKSLELHTDSGKISGSLTIDSLNRRLIEAKNRYNRSVYFFMTMGYKDPTKDLEYYRLQTHGYQAYSEWLNKLLFGLQEEIYLQTPDIDEIPLNTYYMERTFGTIKSRTFILMFPREFNGQDLLQNNQWIKLHIKEFGLGCGKVSFQFDLPLRNIIFTGIQE